MRLAALLLAALLLAGTKPAEAQVTAADSSAVLLDLATRLRTEGRVTLASSLLDIIIERWGTSDAATRARALRTEWRNLEEEQSGKTEFVVWSTTYGVLMGVLWPIAFEAESAAVFGAGLLFGGPIGYAIGRGVISTRSMSEGQAEAISFGSLWGAFQTAGWMVVFDLASESRPCGPFGTETCTSDDDHETILAISLLGSAAGTATGAILSNKPIAAGTASSASLGAMWGLWYGFVASTLTADESAGDREWAIALISGNVGLVSAALLARRYEVSRPRARLISMTGVAGLLAGFGVLLVADAEEYDNAAILVPAATSALGLVLGARWTRNYRERAFDGGQDGALLEWNQKLRFGMPQPGLRMLETRRNGQPAYSPGIGIPLFKARF